MSNTTYTDSLEPVERLAEKVKSLIDVLERTQTELAETIDNNQQLQREFDNLNEQFKNAENTGQDMTSLLDEREHIRTRVQQILEQLETLSI